MAGSRTLSTQSSGPHAPASTRAADTFPRAALLGAAALMAFAILAAAAGRLFVTRSVDVPPAEIAGVVELTFEDRPDGSALVRRAADGATLAVLPSDGGGFLRGVMRSLTRQRRISGLGSEAPYELVRRHDGRFVILDPATRTRIELNGFGASNVMTVAAVFAAGRATTLGAVGTGERLP